jgi:glucose/arabinose dehydrogenase
VTTRSTRRRAPPWALACATALVLGGAWGAAAQSGLGSRPSNPACLAPARPLAGTAAEVSFEPTFSAGSTPTALHRSSDDPSVWYVALKEGRIRRVEWTSGAPSITEMLDLVGTVVTGPEAGFTGMAFHPDFATNGHVYVHYSGANDSPDAPGPFTEFVTRFTSDDGGLTLDPGSEVVLLALPQHGIFHHGGKMAFGPDGYLYVGFGDGNAPEEAQDVFQWYGKILRLDVDGGTPSAEARPRCGPGDCGIPTRSPSTA